MVQAPAILHRNGQFSYNMPSRTVLQRYYGAALHEIGIMTQEYLPGMARWGSIGTYLSPAVMRWARKWRGLTIEETARKLSVQPSQVEAWESALEYPTLSQARKLAKECKRPYVEFFLDKPPKPLGARQIEDFRTTQGREVEVTHPDFRDLLIWVDGRRSDALDLHEELRGKPPRVPETLNADIQSDPEIIASLARKAMGMVEGHQAKIAAHTYPDYLRDKFEDLGVITFKHGDLSDFGARGICFADSELPAVVLSSEARSAQAFTLAHEFGHIVLKYSGIIDPLADKHKKETEKWCDGFAAAFLMPMQEIAALLLKLDIDQNTIADGLPDEVLSYMAKYFRVSEEAMLIRLVHQELVAPSYYWDVKRPEFEEFQEVKPYFAGKGTYASRYIKKMGRLYTGLVIEAWDADMITNHNAAEYMEIGKFSHLMEVRKIMASRD